MEKYLVEEYNVFEDKEYLKNENEIEDYFKDNGSNWFDCGQGYYEDYSDLFCKVGNKFYLVKLKAEIMSEKRDVGEKLYFIDYISSVEYEEIEKPKPKEKTIVTYNLELTLEQKNLLENYMEKNYINF